MTQLNLYVFRPEGAAFREQNCFGIAYGSAMVGEENLGLIRLDYEGDIYGQGMNFAQKTAHATYRHLLNYPTVARKSVHPTHLVEVGIIDVQDENPFHASVVTIHPGKQELLDAWVDHGNHIGE